MTSKRFYVTSMFLACLCHFSGATQLESAPAKTKTMRVLLLPFNVGQNVPPALAGSSTELMRSALVNKTPFIVADETAVATALQERAIQRSGCTDTACAIKIGRALEVERTITGIISRSGSSFRISASLIHVNDGRVEQTEVAEVVRIEELAQATQSLAARFAARTFAKEYEDPFAAAMLRSAMWRSSILPGWGQSYLGESERARWLIGATTLMAVFVWSGRLNTASTRAELREWDSYSLLLRDEYSALLWAAQRRNTINELRGWQRSRDGATATLSVIWLLNLADIYFFSSVGSYPNSGAAFRKDAHNSFGAEWQAQVRGRDGISISANFRF